VIPAAFEYLAPHTVDEAVGLLERHGDDAKLLAGGQSLIPLMKFRLAQPAVLIDVNRIPGLDFIQETDGDLYLGPLSRESDVESSEMLTRRWPILVDASRVIADPIVRNLATVGGNVAHGDPANDHPAVMLALRAQVSTQGPGGKRTIPADQFFVDTFQTALQPTEMLVEIRAPAQPPRSSGAYFKLERKVGDFAVAGVAVQISLGAQGTFERVGIGLTNVGPLPIRASQAEEFLVGKAADEATLRQAADLAAHQAQPISDQRGSADYKRGIVRTLAVRALRLAVERAQGGTQ
jgi:aerobic carbon-monoxide dehydrogenase medium subunit